MKYSGLLTFFIFGCISCGPKKEFKSENIEAKSKSDEYSRLYGTWVCHKNSKFVIIEITDTANVVYQSFIDRAAYGNIKSNDRYYYYKSKATMGYRRSDLDPENKFPRIWISTDDFRFDYKVRNDSLIEYDKMGDQNVLIKIREN